MKICNILFVSGILLLSVFLKDLNAKIPDVTGYVRHYSGVLVNNNDFAIVQNTFNLNIEQKKEKIAFKVNPYIYHYPGEDISMGLREAYLDIYFDSLDIRLGKQQIIWGKADGDFVTDVVSPKDLTEYRLRDFDEIRMGVTSLKADYYLGDHTLELVWVPVFTATVSPAGDSIWAVKPDFPVVPTIDSSDKDVPFELKNSEAFMKFSALTSLVDIEVMGGYMWDDDPALHIIEKTVDPSTQQLASLTVAQRHHRLGLTGASFSASPGGFVIRGEGAFYIGKYFQTEDPTSSDGTIKKNYLHYLIGIDYTVWEIKLSSQIIQKAILEHDDYIKNDRLESTVTFFISRDFFRETLHLEVFSYFGVNQRDALIRPKIIYKLADGFELLIGANIFIGDEGKYGQYNENDMVYGKVKYSF